MCLSFWAGSSVGKGLKLTRLYKQFEDENISDHRYCSYDLRDSCQGSQLSALQEETGFLLLIYPSSHIHGNSFRLYGLPDHLQMAPALGLGNRGYTS